ncbi:hypothetical protein Pint_22230 [Pistacia integerrima]|uniref:Uncharacterized protein n=1 Tax=Pistacia integerrima TaxID=434235 RepID=A0ACC0YPB0_9ROSI|nr:hypothetical protein Pint_22230 [Pistacia integerrima]
MCSPQTTCRQILDYYKPKKNLNHIKLHTIKIWRNNLVTYEIQNFHQKYPYHQNYSTSISS